MFWMDEIKFWIFNNVIYFNPVCLRVYTFQMDLVNINY